MQRRLPLYKLPPAGGPSTKIQDHGTQLGSRCEEVFCPYHQYHFHGFDLVVVGNNCRTLFPPGVSRWPPGHLDYSVLGIAARQPALADLVFLQIVEEALITHLAGFENLQGVGQNLQAVG